MAKSGLAAAIEKARGTVARAFGGGIPAPDKQQDRRAQLQAALDSAATRVADAKELRELALMAIEDGEPDARQQLDRAEAELDGARRAHEQIRDALMVAERVADRQSVAAAAKARAAALVQLSETLRQRQAAAARVDALVSDLGAAIAEIDGIDEQIRVSQSKGIGSSSAALGYNYGGSSVRDRVRPALVHAGLIADYAPHGQPSLAEWSELLTSTLLGDERAGG